MLQELIKKFEETLLIAGKERPQRSFDDWIEHERNVMAILVNKERREIGKEPVPMEAILRVETLAVGHTDYAHKFSIGCARLVLDLDRST